MAAGEQKWSSRGEVVKRFISDPIAKGTYPAELLKDGMEVKRAKDNPEFSIPRIGVRFAMHGTAKEEGQKDRLYFHDFYLSLNPGKDGVAMPNRGGQLIEFARANGDELDGIDLQDGVILDKDGNQVNVKYLDPGQVMEYLESKVGTVHDLKLNIEQDTAQADEPAKGLKKGDKYPISEDHPGRNKAVNFVVDEAAMQQAEQPQADDVDDAPPAKVTTLPTKKTAAAPVKAAPAKAAGKKK